MMRLHSTVKDSDQAFTLIESLIAITILGIVMAGSMAFYYQANTMYYRGLHYQLATWLADSQMEACKGLGDSLIPTSNSECSLTNTVDSIQGLSAQQSVTINNQLNANYDDVKVTVSWKEPKEATFRNVSLETYM
jgi:prepilin-type N-terminal cleavage/methylation domain-containing protein